MNFAKNKIYTTYNNQDNTGKRTGADNDKTKKENSGDACGEYDSCDEPAKYSRSIQAPAQEKSPYRAKNKPPAQPVIMIVWILEKNAFEKYIKNIQACYNRKKRRTVFMQLKGGQRNG